MQGRRIILAVISGFAALSFSTSALAVMSACNGWYAEGNIGYSKLSSTNYSGAHTTTSGLPYNGNVGYKFMPFFGLEIGYTKYSDTNISGDGERAGSDTLKSFQLSGRGIIPVGLTGFEGIVKVGVQRLDSHVSIADPVAAADIGLNAGSRRKTGLFIGAGGQYYFTPEFAVVVQWQRAQAQSGSHIGNADLYSAGLSYIFI